MRPLPETSILAAQFIKPLTGRLNKMIFDFLALRGPFGATAEEIELGLNLSGNTVRPRIIDLMDRGMVTRSDRCRKNRSGRLAGVMVVASLANPPHVRVDLGLAKENSPADFRP